MHEGLPFIGEHPDCLNEDPVQTRCWNFDECNTKIQGLFFPYVLWRTGLEENR